MSAASHGQRVFSIPSGAPFLATFVTALLDGTIFRDVSFTDAPFALADARIFIPTRRAARALTDEFARQTKSSALLLPQIVPLGQMDDTADAVAFAPVTGEDAWSAALNPVAGDIERRLGLSQLIMAWSKQLSGVPKYHDGARIVVDEDALNIVTRSPVHAFHMSGELAALIDEMIIENIDPENLATLPVEQLDRYWNITLDFLKIAFEGWPAHLKEIGKDERATRQSLLIDREIELLTNGQRRGAQIVLGSTGTNAATARLIAAIARLPMGAVILPGFDTQMDEASWQALARESGSEQPLDPVSPAPGHPQAALRRLVDGIGIDRKEIVTLGEPVAALRMNFVHEALRPASTTDHWGLWRRNHLVTVNEALRDVSVIEADDERHEALAIAIALREALETPDATAALITPDRNLARRVRAELHRWNIEIDDSGGELLSATPAGNLALLALEAAQKNPSSAALFALLDHQSVRLGLDDAEFARLRTLASVSLLRGMRPLLDDPAQTIALARELGEGHYAHPSRGMVKDEDWPALENFVQCLRHALAPLREMPEQSGVAAWMNAHEATLARLCELTVANEDSRLESAAAIANIWRSDDGHALLALFESFRETGSGSLALTLTDYIGLLAGMLRETIVRGPQRAHPRLKILGLLEARLIEADLFVLAGLVETVWPPAAQSSAFLNRPMRAALGLSSPERRIGQTAHDFVQAMGAPRIVLSLSKKRGGSPAAPSRFLQRMSALAGENPWAQCRARGARYLHWAKIIDQPGAPSKSIEEPRPCPVVALRPDRFSVTEIETWRRDPYSIYAKKILRLQPMEDIDPEEGAAEIGTMLHQALADFLTRHAHGPLPAKSADILTEYARERLAPLLTQPDFRFFRWPRLQVTLREYIEWEAERRALTDTLLVEQSGRIDISLADGSALCLTARADRMEQLTSGAIAICDFKTGAPPSAPQVNSGLAPQLTLEAAMVQMGGFTAFAAKDEADAPAPELWYLGISSKGKFTATRLGDGKTKLDIGAVITQHFEGLVQMANQFRSPDTPYRARPVAKFKSQYLKYDHLSRYKEWSSISASGES